MSSILRFSAGVGADGGGHASSLWALRRRRVPLDLDPSALFLNAGEVVEHLLTHPALGAAAEALGQAHGDVR